MYYLGSPNNVGQDPPLFEKRGEGNDGMFSIKNKKINKT